MTTLPMTGTGATQHFRPQPLPGRLGHPSSLPSGTAWQGGGAGIVSVTDGTLSSFARVARGWKNRKSCARDGHGGAGPGSAPGLSGQRGHGERHLPGVARPFFSKPRIAGAGSLRNGQWESPFDATQGHRKGSIGETSRASRARYFWRSFSTRSFWLTCGLWQSIQTFCGTLLIFFSQSPSSGASLAASACALPGP